ncbi:type II restriction endonuclease [Tumidithrix elongata RA019]|uniref:Type II restriction endonuclease n=1 Tax=Tumidithrix elongata BACA0141 TaxID=2716417 RepID=A0AAW9Q5B0_9CYAN|nr:type II restriction endonuclease [Tumidithrix elongata RA019]
MKSGHLSEYFTGVAAKRLSAVESDIFRSHQHEFNGVKGLKQLFGSAKQTYQAKFIYLNDHDDEPPVDDGYLTWYDARENHPNRSEYRLYFPDTLVSQCAAEGDLLVIGTRPDNSVLVIIAENDSTISNQIQWLFGLTNLSHSGFSVRGELETDQDRIEFTSRFILENIGIAIESNEENYLETMLEKFEGSFPNTRIFSEHARSTLQDINLEDGLDSAIMAWMEREEILFRTLERYLIADRLSKGFDNDVEGFLAFSLSVQNRRKSRVGYALENHLETIFTDSNIRYSRGKVTENRSKPDFLFPGQAEYKDPNFNPLHLTMLGVKSTCKDRWRQVLSEANRISTKHLLTLETAISNNQTEEMRFQRLQLVIPRSLHSTYTPKQQAWLMDLTEFVEYLRQYQ